MAADRALGSRPSARYVVADLRDEFEFLDPVRPRLAALWYWGQALGIGLRLCLTPAGNARPTPTQSCHPGDQMRNELGLAFRALVKRPVLSSATY